MPTLKELLLSFFDSVEELAIENLKLRTIISSMPMAQSKSFSLDDLIQETELAGESERGSRAMYAIARETIQQQSDPEEALKKLLEQFPRYGGLH